MYNLMLSIVFGALSCVAYWVYYTYVQPRDELIDKATFAKVFITGLVVSYLLLLSGLVSSNEQVMNVADSVSKTVTSATENIETIVENTIKIGNPSF